MEEAGDIEDDPARSVFRLHGRLRTDRSFAARSCHRRNARGSWRTNPACRVAMKRAPAPARQRAEDCRRRRGRGVREVDVPMGKKRVVGRSEIF